MHEVSLQEIKRIEYEGLCRIKIYCQENDLSYYLAFGTLLGAVRHGGFIPWDDDIDLYMPISSYDAFVKLANDFEDDDWELNHYKINEKFVFPWMKITNKRTKMRPSRFSNGYIYGACIDVFPLFPITLNSDDEMEKIYEDFRRKYLQIISKVKQFRILSGGKRDAIRNVYDSIYYRIYSGQKYSLIKEYEMLFGMLPIDSGGEYYVNPFDPYHSILKKGYFENSKVSRGRLSENP